MPTSRRTRSPGALAPEQPSQPVRTCSPPIPGLEGLTPDELRHQDVLAAMRDFQSAALLQALEGSDIALRGTLDVEAPAGSASRPRSPRAILDSPPPPALASRLALAIAPTPEPTGDLSEYSCAEPTLAGRVPLPLAQGAPAAAACPPAHVVAPPPPATPAAAMAAAAASATGQSTAVPKSSANSLLLNLPMFFEGMTERVRDAIADNLPAALTPMARAVCGVLTPPRVDAATLVVLWTELFNGLHEPPAARLSEERLVLWCRSASVLVAHLLKGLEARPATLLVLYVFAQVRGGRVGWEADPLAPQSNVTICPTGISATVKTRRCRWFCDSTISFLIHSESGAKAAMAHTSPSSHRPRYPQSSDMLRDCWQRVLWGQRAPTTQPPTLHARGYCSMYRFGLSISWDIFCVAFIRRDGRGESEAGRADVGVTVLISNPLKGNAEHLVKVMLRCDTPSRRFSGAFAALTRHSSSPRPRPRSRPYLR